MSFEERVRIRRSAVTNGSQAMAGERTPNLASNFPVFFVALSLAQRKKKGASRTRKTWMAAVINEAWRLSEKYEAWCHCEPFASAHPERSAAKSKGHPYG
jgi:hypothetical protein